MHQYIICNVKCIDYKRMNFTDYVKLQPSYSIKIVLSQTFTKSL
jgi:hypothetical protein